MAREPVAQFPAQAELAAFARVAGRLLATDVPRAGDSRATRRQRGSGLIFLEHRDYQPGDDIRHINWPLTARLGRPVVREFQTERRADWLLCVDASSSMASRRGSKWRCAVQLAAGMSYALLELGHRVALALFADGVLRACTPGRGQSQYLRIRGLLGSDAPRELGARSHLGSCAPRLGGISATMVFSDFLAADALRSDLTRFSAQCVETRAIQIVDRHDWQLPAAKALELIDVETGAHASWIPDRSAADGVTAAATDHTRNLARFCAGAGILFSCAEVSSTWQQSLLGHLAAASRR